jgi:hypothetical protein
MSKVVDIRSRGPVPEKTFSVGRDVPPASSLYSFSRLGRTTWSVARLPLHLLLYWLRWPVLIACKLVSLPMLFAFLFSLYAFPERRTMVWTFGVLSFAFFVAFWLYDSLLLWLSPQRTF